MMSSKTEPDTTTNPSIPVRATNKLLTSLSTYSKVVDDFCYRRSVAELNRYMETETSLSDILDTAYSYRGYGIYQSISPLQIRSEIRQMCEFVEETDPEVVLEIGTGNGGTFYTMCRYFSAQKLISLDLPFGPYGGRASNHRISLYEQFAPNKNLEFIRRNSHEKATVESVDEACREKQIDFALIDGDHTYEGVKRDFELYSKLVAPGGIIALHDIVPHPDESEVEVDRFWKDLKTDYETKEIVSPQEVYEQKNLLGGIGLVYM